MSGDPQELALARDGAEYVKGVLDQADVADLEQTLPSSGSALASRRIFAAPALDRWLGPTGRVGALVAARLGEHARPVRALLLDKLSHSNWSLGWHQDRVIAVKARRQVAGFTHWTRKGGVLHVEPPFDLLARMLTARIHLDDVERSNAPLEIARGSHRLGRVPERDIAGVVGRCGVMACLARAGDVWLYSTAILHKSEAAVRPARRRVLQVDYCADELPGGLEWKGVCASDAEAVASAAGCANSSAMVPIPDRTH